MAFLKFSPDFPYYLRSLALFYGVEMVPVEGDADVVLLASEDGLTQKCVIRLALGDNAMEVWLDLNNPQADQKISKTAEVLRNQDKGRRSDVAWLEKLADL